MNERQQRLLRRLYVQAHIARALGMYASSFNAKLEALKYGKNPMFSSNTKNPILFATIYKEKQIEFWGDLAVIAAEKLKELEVKNGN